MGKEGAIVLLEAISRQAGLQEAVLASLLQETEDGKGGLQQGHSLMKGVHEGE